MLGLIRDDGLYDHHSNHWIEDSSPRIAGVRQLVLLRRYASLQLDNRVKAWLGSWQLLVDPEVTAPERRNAASAMLRFRADAASRREATEPDRLQQVAVLVQLMENSGIMQPTGAALTTSREAAPQPPSAHSGEQVAAADQEVAPPPRSAQSGMQEAAARGASSTQGERPPAPRSPKRQRNKRALIWSSKH